MSTLVASSRQAVSGSRQECEARFGVLGLLRSGLGQFKDNKSGDVAMMFGLMALVMTMFVGGAVDFGRWLSASRQTKAAIDAAVLAGARVMQLDSSPTGIQNAKVAAKKYYDENVKTRSTSVYSDTVTFVVNGTTEFTATGNAQIPTPFLRVMELIPGVPAIDHLPLLKNTTADFSVAKLASGGNAQYSVEIGLMLDTSGSMSGTKITDMKLAAKDLVDIVVWDNQGSSQYTAKVALAPFSADVRLATTMNAPARGSSPAATVSVLTPGTCYSGKGKNKVVVPCPSVAYSLTSCVAERQGSNRYTDAAPGVGNYVMAKYDPSASCSQPSQDAVVALSNDKNMLKTKIDGLVIGGGTAGHLGTAWAWYTISPNWGSVFPSTGQPQAYNTPNLKKIAILMTDGEYNTEYSTYGVNTGESPAGPTANGTSIDQAKALCDGMKAKGITVYTVGFDLGGNTTAISTLSYCASSSSNFYNAADGTQLRQSFRDIALKISALYLSK